MDDKEMFDGIIIGKLEDRVKLLEAILDGDPNQTETPETRRAWRHSAVLYADKCEKHITELERLLGIDTPFPVWEILKELIPAAEILLNHYNYDGHGYEGIGIAIEHAKKLIPEGGGKFCLWEKDISVKWGPAIHSSCGNTCNTFYEPVEGALCTCGNPIKISEGGGEKSAKDIEGYKEMVEAIASHLPKEGGDHEQ